MSGVDVATMIRSISSARTPADSSAASDAGSARSLEVTCGSAKCRAWMPVRSTIHSCEVSIPSRARRSARAELVTRLAGR